jgi:alpha-tubulin suppressor-like RCC1 family protein
VLPLTHIPVIHLLGRVIKKCISLRTISSQFLSGHIFGCMRKQHVAILTTIVLVVFCSVNNTRDARADTAGGALIDATGVSTQSQAHMRYITSGDNHTCVVLVDNSVKCFGMGADGQLGNGSTDNIGDGTGLSVVTSSAVALGVGRTVRSIAAGAAHTCALLDNATVKCWGSGLYGRLGYEDSTNKGDSTGQMADSLPAVALGTGRTALQITVGSQHSCALLDNYSVKCWGRGTYGQLGLGSTATIGDGAGEMGDSLVAVAFAAGRSARFIAAGSNHTCAILDNASVVCWGRGNSGQLGQGAITNIGHSGLATVATTPAIDFGSDHTALAISAGDAHTCAILDNATIKCWGAGGNGRLGSGATTNLGDGAGEMGISLGIVDVGAGRTVRAISAGIAHTCAVLDNATVKCWGNGGSGKLGYENQDDIGDTNTEMGLNLAAVALGAGRTALAISAGGTHTCAVLDNASLKCWGDGSSGQLGSNGIAAIGAGPNEMGDALAIVALGSTVNITTEPTAPQSVVAVAGDTQATLSWAAPASNGGSEVTDYVVEYSVQDSGVWSLFEDGVSMSLSATVTGLVNDTSYSFRISARNIVNTSATALALSAITPVTTTTTSTTTTSTTTSTTTTVLPTTTSSSTTTTTIFPATTTSTTTSTTTTTTFTTTTTTTTVVPQLVVARSIPSLLVQPFALNKSALSATQLKRLDRYSNNLKRGDVVTCTSYSSSNPHGTVSRLNVQRARSVCKYLAGKVAGLRFRVVSAIALPATVRSSAAGAIPHWQSLNLLRRVVVEASPGT